MATTSSDHYSGQEDSLITWFSTNTRAMIEWWLETMSSATASWKKKETPICLYFCLFAILGEFCWQVWLCLQSQHSKQYKKKSLTSHRWHGGRGAPKLFVFVLLAEAPETPKTRTHPKNADSRKGRFFQFFQVCHVSGCVLAPAKQKPLQHDNVRNQGMPD